MIYETFLSLSLLVRWQADGPRFDSEAIKGEGGVSPRGMGPSPTHQGYYSPTSGHRRFFRDEKKKTGEEVENGEDDTNSKWQELKDPREMIDYQMSIAVDPTSRKHLIPGAIAAT